MKSIGTRRTKAKLKHNFRFSLDAFFFLCRFTTKSCTADCTREMIPNVIFYFHARQPNLLTSSKMCSVASHFVCSLNFSHRIRFWLQRILSDAQNFCLHFVEVYAMQMMWSNQSRILEHTATSDADYISTQCSRPHNSCAHLLFDRIRFIGSMSMQNAQTQFSR